MNTRTTNLATSRLFSLLALALAAAACGGGDDDATGSPGTGTVEGKACSGPADCPSGYSCVTTTALSAPFPQGPCEDICGMVCMGDPQCMAGCLMDCSGGAGGSGTAGSGSGVGGSGPASDCNTLCAKIAAQCGADAGADCGATCPGLSATCFGCIATSPNVCLPTGCEAVCTGGPGAGGSSSGPGAGGSGTGPGAGGSGPGAGGSGTGQMGVCKANAGPGAGGSGTAGSGTAGTGTAGTGTAGTGTAGSGPQPIKWAGTWTADVEYEVACKIGTSTDVAKQKFTVTVAISGSNSNLTFAPSGATGECLMSGPGSDTGLTVNGTFPFRDKSAAVAGCYAKDNQGTVKITSVTGQNAAEGTISGQFQGQFGIDCSVDGGSIKLSR